MVQDLVSSGLNIKYSQATPLLYITSVISPAVYIYIYNIGYTSSVNCIGFPIVSCVMSKSFTDTLRYRFNATSRLHASASGTPRECV